MASTDLPPRFFKLYLSHLSSESMLIPSSYYDEFPNHLPKTAILQGPRGSWKVVVVKTRDEVHFGKGWVKFVEDNRLNDGDFLTFIYNGDRIFEVSIYREEDGCKDIEEDDHKEDQDTDTETESEMAIVPITRSKNKGKLKEKAVEDSDSDDCIEVFGRLDVSEDSKNSDSSYSPSIEDTTACVEPKATNSKKKGKSKLIEYKRSKKVKPRIKNPEAYLVDPTNIHFETNVKNREYELLVLAEVLRDYDLKFEDYIKYIDEKGEVEARAMTWGDGRVVIKNWKCIQERNKLKKDDAVLCELFSKEGVVYAIKLHIVRAHEIRKSLLV